MLILLSLNSLNGQIAVGKVDRLRTGVLHGDRQAAALWYAHLRGNVDIEIVFHGSRRAS